MEQTKICSRCHKEKPITEFYFRRDRGHYIAKCTTCVPNIKKAYREEHKKETAEARKKYYLENRDKELQMNRQYMIENREHVNARRRRYLKKYQSIPKNKLDHNISNGILKSLKRNKNNYHWEQLVGYTLEDLQLHLERCFQDGMTWANYGKIWHVDHVIPKSIFNYNSPFCIDFLRCWSLKNLQPLFAIENIRKKNKIIQSFQPSLALEIL